MNQKVINIDRCNIFVSKIEFILKKYKYRTHIIVEPNIQLEYANFL